jgi:hypothetical protein
MALDSDRRVVYEMVLQEAGSTAEVALYVNGAVLTEVWPRLFLPQRVRELWEARFRNLTRVA